MGGGGGREGGWEKEGGRDGGRRREGGGSDCMSAVFSLFATLSVDSCRWSISLHVGAQVFEKVVVEKVEVKNGRVSGVKTNLGSVQCDIFVNCAGQVSL